MEKELTSFETADQIIRDICCSKSSHKKRNREKMVETDIDIFANEDHLQIKEGMKDDNNSAR